ncbi:unnamed protein product [Durusdinium trenchii]|uniref:Uncharacterized protein n=3 Tax=Durusdinium trenchii TaxID=1381693 RepID=A0ABP0RN00_9DINO
MGCCGSVDKDTTERLENVSKEIKTIGLSADSDSLKELARHAKELQEIFEVFANAGDMRMIERVQDLSDAIVRNLIGRIDLELLKKGAAEYQPTLDAIMAVATDLDTVRATKATKLVESHLSRHLEQVQAAQEKQVDPIIKKIQALRAKLQEPGQAKNLVPGTKDIVDSAEQTFKAAPEAKQVAKALLEELVPHSVWILESEAFWSNAQASDQVVELSKRVDALAQDLVALLGATWDPPITPQAERVRLRKATEACGQLVSKAQKHLEADEGGEAYNCLQELLPWWPHLKSSHSLEIVGLFSKMQSYAQEAFLAAAKAGHSESAEEIRGFAVQFDELRAKFEGLPAASGRPLGEALESGEAKIQVAKALDVVDAEVAKSADDDESTNLSLATTIQALESLKMAWPVASKSDSEELYERLKNSCSGLEKFIIDTISSCPVEQITSFLQFAQEYDSRRSTIDGSEPLRPRLTSDASVRYLSQAEGELGKTEGMKPHILLDSLKAVVAISDGSDSKVRTQLLRVMSATDERLLKSFVETISAEVENEKKELLLQKFAESADEVRVACSIPGRPLVEAMREKRTETASELISTIRDEISAGQVGSLAKELGALSRICKRLPPESSIPKEAAAVGSRFLESLATAPLAEVEMLMPSISAVSAALKDLGGDAADLRGKLLGRVCAGHLVAARNTTDLTQLGKELDILEKCRKDEALSAQLGEEISQLAQSLEETFLARLLEEGRAKGSAVLDLAIVADGWRDEPMLPRLTKAHKVVGLFEEAMGEVQKTSGMNPKVVVTVLKDLGPLLESVASLEAYRQRLLTIVEKFREKLEEACQKALAAEGDVEARLAGLLKLAESGDVAQEAFLSVPELSYEKKNFTDSISKVGVKKALESIEAELSKESGMNPKLLLQKFQELGKWGTLQDTLKDRYQASCDKVSQRMKDSMQDAKTTSNTGKQKALLQFAKEFDMASNSSLEAELQALLGDEGV